MSLILNDNVNVKDLSQSFELRMNHPDIDRLDRYLAIIETNKKSSQFVPNDALLALDMAGFAMGQLKNRKNMPDISIGRLAMALVQPERTLPVQ